MAARVLYAPKDHAEASEISQELGYTTVHVKSLSRPGGDPIRDEGDEPRQRRVSEQSGRFSCRRRSKSSAVTGSCSCRRVATGPLAWKNRYFEDPFLSRRLLPPPGRATSAHVATRPAPAAAAPATAAEAPSVARPAPRRRAATTKDIEHIEELTVEDFDTTSTRLCCPRKRRRALFERGTRRGGRQLHQRAARALGDRMTDSTSPGSNPLKPPRETRSSENNAARARRAPTRSSSRLRSRTAADRWALNPAPKSERAARGKSAMAAAKT